MKLVFSDADTLGTDVKFEEFERLGEVVVYGYTKPEELQSRCDGADILITNKNVCNENTLGLNPTIKMIAVTATGTNIIDMEYVRKHNIAVANVKGYSTESVAQHTFALLFYLMEKSAYYDRYVKSGKYIEDNSFTHFANTFNELNGKTWGIVGLGEIGRRVYDIAKAFGCKAVYYSTSGRNHNSHYDEVDFDTLLSESDVISIHAPLTPDTENLFDGNAFARMKNTAIIINVGRGPIINERDLYEALISRQIGAAGLDVLKEEPMSKDNPLFAIKDSDRLIITPHIAWATVEARERLMKEVLNNIKCYIAGERVNRID